MPRPAVALSSRWGYTAQQCEYQNSTGTAFAGHQVKWLWVAIMQIAIDLPNDFVQFQTDTDIQQEIRLSYAIWLYQQQRVTLGKAAELAGVDIYDFMSFCKANKVPVIDLSRDEILEELEGFKVS